MTAAHELVRLMSTCCFGQGTGRWYVQWRSLKGCEKALSCFTELFTDAMKQEFSTKKKQKKNVLKVFTPMLMEFKFYRSQIALRQAIHSLRATMRAMTIKYSKEFPLQKKYQPKKGSIYSSGKNFCTKVYQGYLENILKLWKLREKYFQHLKLLGYTK